MRRGDPDTGCGVHGVEQVLRQIAQRTVECVHKLGHERKPRVGITNNRTDGHDLSSYVDERPRRHLFPAARTRYDSQLERAGGINPVKF